MPLPPVDIPSILEGAGVVIGSVGLQVVLIIVSAIAGAGSLLFLQTIYRRLKLLRGLESELGDNLKKIGEAGNAIHETEDIYAVTGFDFSNHVFLSLMAKTPILYVRLTRGLSPIGRAYRGVARLQNLGDAEFRQTDAARTEMLEMLEGLEGVLFKAGLRLREVQRESRIYRMYNRLFLKENLDVPPGFYSKIVGTDDGLKEVYWRPSGLTSNERREEILEEDEEWY